MKWGWLVVLVVLSGCVAPAKTFGPDGRPAYAIACSGALFNWGVCYKQAGDLCGSSGYNIVAKDGDRTAIAGGSSGMFAASSAQNRTMMVECKKPS